MDAAFVRKHLVAIAIAIFLAVFSIVNYLQPGLLYNQDGSIRQFGVGRRLSTVVPVWLAAMLLGIFSYMAAIQLMRSLTY
jgi:hypothetical protein